MFEVAFFEAFVMGRTGQLPIEDVLGLLAYADRAKLRAIGTEFSVTEPITLYRGTAKPDLGLARRSSWTTSIEVAGWFARREAKRMPGGVAAVYQLAVPPERLVFFTNERNEQEYFVEMWPEAKPRRIKVADQVRSGKKKKK